MDAADLLPGELVHIVDITNGARLETYVIEGERGSGVIGVNGAAAHLTRPGHKVIIASFAAYDAEDLETYDPVVVHVNDSNEVAEIDSRPEVLLS